MAHKDQLSSKKDRCDICGTTLDDDAVIQEFPDGSVVKLCDDCATAAAPDDEPEIEEDLGLEDATAEWSGPDVDRHAAGAPARFEPEVFEPEESEPELAAAADVDDQDPDDVAARVAAELAAWASAPSSDDDTHEEEVELEENFDEEAAEDAALELVAAIAEADMAEEAEDEAYDLGDTERFGIAAGAQQAQDETAPGNAAAAAESYEAVAAPVAVDGDGDEAEAPGKSKEWLVPVTDLLALQNEMQSALARLSSTLEHFVSDMVATEEKTTAINSRLHELEDELESTRERLRVTESLLPESAFQAIAAVAAATAVKDTDLLGALPLTQAAVPPPLPSLPGVPSASLVPPPMGAAAPAPGAAPPPLPPTSATKPASMPAAKAETTVPTPPPIAQNATATPPATPARPKAHLKLPMTGASAPLAAAGVAASVGAGTAVPVPLPVMPAPGAAQHAHSVAVAAAAMQKLLRGRKGHQPPAPAPEPEPEPEPQEESGLTFSINEVQVAQRYFNESEFTKKISEISKSIGRPKANVSRTLPGASEAAITVFWDIVWYQYVVDLHKDLPVGEDRVWLDREGMDLEELEPRFRDKNGTINDGGRLDASELEVRLLSDPSALITEMEVSSPETRLAEDATEEIWDQQSAPDFRWD